VKIRAGITAVMAAALIAGCGGGGDDSNATSAAQTPTATQVVVQASDGGFNPAQIFNDVAPGVVTITSIFEGGASDLLGGGGSAGQGSGFVVDRDGNIVTNAHVVTSGGHLNGGGTPREAKQVFVEFGDRNRVAADIVGFDADADVAVIKVDPEVFGELRVEGLACDAEVGVVHRSIVLELIERIPHGGHRDREADAGVAARARGDLLVDPNHLSLGVEQRATRVPRVDRRIGLEHGLLASADHRGELAAKG